MAPLPLPLLAALLAAVPAAPPGDPLPALARAAVEDRVGLAGARAELLELDGGLPPGCAPARAEVPSPLSASGRVPLRLVGAGVDGRPCEAWAWARVRVSAPTLVTTRPVREGDALEGAVAQVDREVQAGRAPLASLPEGARADRALPAGAAVDEGVLRVGPRPGEPVSVVLRAGALVVEQRAEAVSCRRARACALLPTGRRVEGTWHDGRIELSRP